MKHQLRKRHLKTWMILAIALPLLFLLAVLSIPKKAVQDKLYQPPVKSVID